MAIGKIGGSEGKIKLSSSEHNFPVVGIGASAGGLEAFKLLVKAIPLNSEMAYVLVQHLNPEHESNLTEILSKATKIPISEISNDIKILPNHIYVIPAGKILTSVDGVLKLTPRERIKTNLVIDIFFTSLAVVWESMAVGVVLSGTGSDGTLGLKMIKEHGGITMVQDEGAAYGDMPRNAVNAGVVDFVLAVEKIPAQLLQINNTCVVVHAYREREPLPKNDEVVFKQILQLLQQRSGVNFTYYKQSTVLRRVGRRMALHKRETMADYLKFLRSDLYERDALFTDMLIPVTSFFRDPKTFEAVTRKVFPALLKNKSPEDTIRLWIAGCSTGQEAYSIAICLHEFLEDKSNASARAQRTIQIFASDISDKAINKARAGIYTKAEVQTISKELLRNYFTEITGNYQVNRVIRDMCVFANHNFLKDPPFAKMDLITCRNVLIYMDSYLQKKALTTFHYALKENGILLLGKTETESAASELFTAFDKQHKIYSRKPGAGRVMQVATDRREETITTENRDAKKELRQTDFSSNVDALLISRAPAAVVVNDQMEIVHIYGDIAPFLKNSAGPPSFNLIKMAREGLAFELRNALYKVKTSTAAVIKREIPVYENDKQSFVTVEIIPLLNTIEPHNLVLFTKVYSSGIEKKAKFSTAGKKSKLDETFKRIEQLEKELFHTREDMRCITEEMESANEELQSANEELQSSNEEMQSLNEELETSKEELQSSNEELTILNQELIDKEEQLNAARDYSGGIVSTIKESLLVLDKSLRIISANTSFYRKFDLTEAEAEGRLFYELQNYQWNNNDLRKRLESIFLKNGKLEDFEMIIDGHVLLLSAQKIISEKNAAQLILLAIQDVTDSRMANKLKESEKSQAKIAAYLKLATDSANVGTWSLDFKAQTLEWNDVHKRMWGYNKQQEVHHYEEWHKSILSKDKEKVLKKIEEAKVTHTVYETDYYIKRADDDAIRCIRSVGKYYYNDKGEAETLTGISVDITDEREAQKQLKILAGVVETSVDAINVTDRAGNILIWNKSSELLFGYNAIEIIGQNLNIVYAPEKLKEEQDIVRRLNAGEFIPGYKLVKIKKDGTRFPVSLTVSTIKNEKGEPAYFARIIRDITELQQTEEKIRQLNISLEEKVKSRTDELFEKNKQLEYINAELTSFTNVASHDLQEPLRKIQMFSRYLIDLETFSEKAQGYFNRIIASSERMQNLISSLLEFSRTTAVNLIFKPTDLNAVVEESKEDLHLSIIEKQAVIESTNLPIVNGVHVQFSQVITNLINNALKYSRPNITPHVKITSERIDGNRIEHPAVNKHKGYHAIKITDNGIGFEEEYANKIFDLFQRLHDKNEYSGTGIGLAIVKKIVTNHNGFITAAGKPGIGATFTIYIPAT